MPESLYSLTESHPVREKWAALRDKVPNGLSHSHTIFFRFILFGLKSWCHTKSRMGAATCADPSFGMSATQDITEVTDN